MELNELRHWAVLGLETKLAELKVKMDGIFLELGSKPKAVRKKHRISKEGRARIAEAQRKRWAAVSARKSA